MLWSLKLFFSFWFAVWGLPALFGLLFMRGRDSLLVFLMGSGLVLVGMVFIEAQKCLDRRDQAYLCSFIGSLDRL